MKNQPQFLRYFLLVFVSLAILFLVVLFAPAAQAPERDALTTRVAAATVVPFPTWPPPTRVAIADTNSTPAQMTNSSFVFSAERDGYRELYAATRANLSNPTQWRQLTNGYAPARAPALAPDGTRVAFQSRKDGNWEIYVLNLATNQITRVTNGMAYDGAPAWSADGKQLAFESYRGGDLDIWKANADGSEAVNLTQESESYEFAPVWSPDGEHILYTSWEMGNKQLFVMSPNGTGAKNILSDRFHNEQAAWSPDGKKIAFVSNRESCAEKVESTLEQPPLQGAAPSGNCQRRGIFVGEFDGAKLTNVKQVSFLGRDVAPAWSPDGKEIAFVAERALDAPLYFASSAGGGSARVLSNAAAQISTAAWTTADVSKWGATPLSQKPLYVEKPIPSNPKEGSKYDFVGLREVYLAPSYGIVSSTVSESFRALRNRVVSETGIDFLAQLSDMTRLISYVCDNTCDTLSWHKSGRAVDTLLTLPQNGREAIVLVRQDVNAEVYWRVYLRAAKQDGSQGEPLKDAPWNISVNARAKLAPGLGGMEDEIARGYFVDFTALAHEYGWNRISSHDDTDFDWRNNREALEYWHFQKEGGLNWWQAMQEVYPPEQLGKTFDWETIVGEIGRMPSRTYLKDVPPAPDAWKWYALVP